MTFRRDDDDVLLLLDQNSPERGFLQC